MKFKSSVFSLVFLTLFTCAQNKSDNNNNDGSEGSSETTTYYFVRHAEKDRSDPNEQNPHLTEQGLARAEYWAKELSDIDFDVVYSTDFHRTLETAKPLAKLKNVDIRIYDPSNLNDDGFIEATKGLTVFVVGHSNTTPMFANAVLGENKYDQMDDSDNSGLYIVTIKNGKRSSELKHLKM